ncbi:predicted protein [Postia placenta Mad-698-R]|nr:predicted protein [Postia placenta Mad-698-R]
MSSQASLRTMNLSTIPALAYLRCWDTFHMMLLADPTPSIPYACPIGFWRSVDPQSSTQVVLRARLEKHGRYVEVGTELCSLEQYENKVTASLAKHIAGETLMESMDCRWLVAMDGGRSAVRKLLGLTFQGDAIVGGAIELAPLVSDRDSLLQAFKKGIDRDDVAFGDIINVAEWSNRVFLAGDAAYVHTPAGGQWLNFSIQDAVDPSFSTSEDLRANAYGSQKDDVLRTGDRAPDAPDLVNGEGKTYTLLRVFGPTHHTAVILSMNEEILELYPSLFKAYPNGIVRTLVVSPRGSPGLSKVDGIDTIVVDNGGHAYATSGASDKENIAVAVRPMV